MFYSLHNAGMKMKNENVHQAKEYIGILSLSVLKERHFYSFKKQLKHSTMMGFSFLLHKNDILRVKGIDGDFLDWANSILIKSSSVSALPSAILSCACLTESDVLLK